MQLTIGAVYSDDQGTDFIVTIDQIDGATQTIDLRLVNVVNWISLGGVRGKQLTNGRIDCPYLQADKISLVAQSVFDYKPPHK